MAVSQRKKRERGIVGTYVQKELREECEKSYDKKKRKQKPCILQKNQAHRRDLINAARSFQLWERKVETGEGIRVEKTFLSLWNRRRDTFSYFYVAPPPKKKEKNEKKKRKRSHDAACTAALGLCVVKRTKS